MNVRPPRPKRGALPSCATSRQHCDNIFIIVVDFLLNCQMLSGALPTSHKRYFAWLLAINGVHISLTLNVSASARNPQSFVRQSATSRQYCDNIFDVVFLFSYQIFIGFCYFIKKERLVALLLKSMIKKNYRQDFL